MKADMGEKICLIHFLKVIQNVTEICGINACKSKCGNLSVRIHPLYRFACTHEQSSICRRVVFVDLLVRLVPDLPFMYPVLIAGNGGLHIFFPSLQGRLISKYLRSESDLR